MRTRIFAGLALAGLLLMGLPTVATAAPEPVTGTGAVTIYVNNYPTQVVEGVPAPTSVFIQGTSPQVPVTGTVTVMVEGVPFGPFALVDRTAEMVLTFPTPGSRPFEVIYSGDATNAPSSVSPGMSVAWRSNASLTVTPEGGAPGGHANVGQTAAFDVAVTSAGGTPTGQVKFFVDGSEVARSVLVNGRTSYSTQFDSGGTHQISATYMGTGAYAYFEIAAQTLVVGEGSDVTLSASAASVPLGGFIDLAALVPADATGTVTFFRGGQNVGSAPVGAGGAASFRLQLNTPGTNEFTASYSGDARYSPATSLPVSVEVAAAPVVPDKPITPVVPAGPGSGATPALAQAASLANTGSTSAPASGILLGLGLGVAGLLTIAGRRLARRTQAR